MNADQSPKIVIVDESPIRAAILQEGLREAVAAFAAEQGVPVNPLHAKGFVSIGCAPCTRAIAPGEPERGGRWWWEQDDQKECGLHADDPRRARPAVTQE